MKKVPETREDITLEWLNSIFQLKYDFRIEKFCWAGPVGKGLGQLSSLERLTLSILSYDSNNNQSHSTLNIILKTLPSNPELRNFIVNEGFCTREFSMYSKVFPAWEKFLDSKNTPKSLRFRHPTCYYGAEEGQGLDYRMILLLEDLNSSDFNLWDNGFKKGLGWEETKAIIKQLALFHAVGMAYKEQQNIKNYFEAFPFLYKESKDKDLVVHFVKSGVEATIQRLFDGDEENIPQGLAKDLNRLGSRSQIDKLQRITFPKGDSAGTITHHDLHANNIMLGGQTLNQVEEAVMFDFQCCSYSNPMKDLTFLLFLSCEPSLFTNRLPQVLKYYHSVFTRAVQKMDSDVEYSLQQIEEDYHKFAVISIVHILMGSTNWCFGSNTSEDSSRRYKIALLETFKRSGNKIRLIE